MKRKLLSLLKQIALLFSVVIKFALFVPIILFMIGFNYTVDRSGLFQGELGPRTVVELLLQGNDVSGFEQMDERQIVRLYAQHVENAPRAVAVGSSRALQLTEDAVGTKDFFNLGVTGADVRDVMTSYYSLVKYEKAPSVLIWSVDPWVLYGSEEAFDARADAELYNEFLQKVLGIDTGYEEPDQIEARKALLDPAYFQGNVEYYRRKQQGKLEDDDGDELPFKIVDAEERDWQWETIKLHDGSILYDFNFRSQTQDEILAGAIAQSETFASLHMEGFTEISPTQAKAIEAFVKYAHQNGTDVIFILSPFHPFLYDVILSRADQYTGFFSVEDWFRNFAKRENIPIYGSYDPLILEDLQELDFYDGVHCSTEAMMKFFPGIDQALSDQESHNYPSYLDEKNRTTPEERHSW